VDRAHLANLIWDRSEPHVGGWRSEIRRGDIARQSVVTTMAARATFGYAVCAERHREPVEEGSTQIVVDRSAADERFAWPAGRSETS
jgi:hypothetical protein